MVRRQGTFVGIQNEKGYLKTLRHNGSSGLIRKGLFFDTVGQSLRETRHFARHFMGAYGSLQIIATPFDFDIHHAFQYTIQALHHHGKLVRVNR